MTKSIEMTKQGDEIVFTQATKQLTRVPDSMIKAAIQFATEWADDAVPEVNVVVTVDGDYEVDVHKWHENPVAVCIREYNGDTLLARFEAEQVFNLIGSTLLQGCPTDEETQLMQDAADQERLEHEEWINTYYPSEKAEDACVPLVEFVSGWKEGRGYGDFSDAPVDVAIKGVDHDQA